MLRSLVGNWDKGGLKEEEKGSWKPTVAARQPRLGEPREVAGHSPQLAAFGGSSYPAGLPGNKQPPAAAPGSSPHRTRAWEASSCPSGPQSYSSPHDTSADPGSVLVRNCRCRLPYNRVMAS